MQKEASFIQKKKEDEEHMVVNGFTLVLKQKSSTKPEAPKFKINLGDYDLYLGECQPEAHIGSSFCGSGFVQPEMSESEKLIRSLCETVESMGVEFDKNIENSLQSSNPQPRSTVSSTNINGKRPAHRQINTILLPFAKSEHEKSSNSAACARSDLLSFAEGEHQKKGEHQIKMQMLYDMLASITCVDTLCALRYYVPIQVAHTNLVRVCDVWLRDGTVRDTASEHIERLGKLLFDSRLNLNGLKCVVCLMGVMEGAQKSVHRNVHTRRAISFVVPESVSGAGIRTTRYKQATSGCVQFGRHALPFEIFALILDYHGRSVMSFRNLYTVNRNVCHVLCGSTIGYLLCSDEVVWDVPYRDSCYFNSEKYHSMYKLFLRNKNMSSLTVKHSLCTRGLPGLKNGNLRRLKLERIPRDVVLLSFKNLTHLSLKSEVEVKNISHLPLTKLKFMPFHSECTLRDLPCTIVDLSIDCRNGVTEIGPLNLTRLTLMHIKTKNACKLLEPFSLQKFGFAGIDLDMDALVFALKHMPLTKLKIKGEKNTKEIVVRTSDLNKLKQLKDFVGVRCTTRVDQSLKLRSMRANLTQFPLFMLTLKKAELILCNADQWTARNFTSFINPSFVHLPIQNYRTYTSEFKETCLLYELMFMLREAQMHIHIDSYLPIWPVAKALCCEKMRFNQFSIVAHNAIGNSVHYDGEIKKEIFYYCVPFFWCRSFIGCLFFGCLFFGCLRHKQRK